MPVVIVSPEDLVVGKTYWVENLGRGAAQMRANYVHDPQQVLTQSIRDGFNFTPKMRFVVTIESKKEEFVPPQLRQLNPWPWEIKLGDIKRIDGKGVGKGWELVNFDPSTYTPLWEMIMDLAHAPVFYERKSTSSTAMQKVFSERNPPPPSSSSSSSLVSSVNESSSNQYGALDDIIKEHKKYGGRRKSKRRRRTRGRRRKRKRTRRLRRRKKKRRTRR